MPIASHALESTKIGAIPPFCEAVGKTMIVDTDRVCQASVPEFPLLSSRVVSVRPLTVEDKG